MIDGGMLNGRVAIVTGAGRGLGRAHALELARQGAAVVVNDLGVNLDGSSSREDPPAESVVTEIRAAGGQALANHDDIADWDAAAELVAIALDEYGRVDAVVNNAGFLRDRMFVNATAEEWDAVVSVHMRGHFCLARHAAAHWRDLFKATREPTGGRIVNTTSGAGLLGSVGQAAYSAAKAGILGLTLVQAAELGRYGVTANAIAPVARTRLTATVFAGTMGEPEDSGSFDAMDPANVSPLVAWLCTAESAPVTGRVFEIDGRQLTLMDGWQRGASRDVGRRLDVGEIGGVVSELVSAAPAPLPVYGAP
jgi:NAD(P)-dependent dehydrogenase (short-subunit alcohol dehydrogenase family)